MTLQAFTAEWCSRMLSLDPNDLPDEVRDTYQRCLIDCVGSVIGSSNTKAAGNIRSFVTTRQVKAHQMPSSSVIGMKEPTNPEWAAFANAAIAHAREIDDSHRYVAGLHPGAVIFSVALALVEAYPNTKDRFEKAVIAGYETACTIGRVMNPEHRNRSFHSAGTINTLGAAVCAGVMLDISREELQSALGFSGSMASGIFSFLGESPDVKRLHVGHAAWAGIVSVMLVQSGLKGPQSVLEHKDGFVSAFSPDSYKLWIKNKQIDDSKFEVLNVYFKPYEACGQAFSTIDACLSIREAICRELSIDEGFEQKELLGYLQDCSISIEAYKAAAVLVGEFPESIEEAQFHLAFLSIIALVFGEISIKIIAEALKDESIKMLVEQVKVQENIEFSSQFPKTRTALVTVIYKQQTGWHKKMDTHLGTPENPLSTEQLKRKFNSVTSDVLNEESRKRILQDLQASRLLTIKSMNELLRK